ncbi:hypothetical protein [Treponema endosymbiont of Eucomonympha sp.]|uniref:hypothetical protein n=1 Tax=Treponema endosymbiont of Eucomonympha sp. TaxID=1580831 RepID=UPI000785A1A8|nr:hypothetical protein [Treponema endosymbiont of Eucomonympha sp.]
MGTGHWAETTLRQIVLSKKGKKPKLLTEKQFKDSIPYILIDQLEGKRFKFYSNERNLPIAKPDDVLLVWDGSIGKR